jgi:chemotaxis protein MotB
MSVFETIGGAKKPKAKEELWLISYADLVTNLMAFFIMLLSMSKYDTVKVNAVTKEASRVRFDTLDTLEAIVKKQIADSKLEKRVSVQLNDFGLNVEFRGEGMFEPGGDALTPLARQELQSMLKVLSKIEPKYSLALEGHTDDVPLVGSRTFKDNWALSSARGVSLMRELATLGVSYKRMNVAGFAETRPKEDPIPLLEALRKPGADRKSLMDKVRLARSANRRVLVRVYQ